MCWKTSIRNACENHVHVSLIDWFQPGPCFGTMGARLIRPVMVNSSTSNSYHVGLM
jgi:hypothetical protein